MFGLNNKLCSTAVFVVFVVIISLVNADQQEKNEDDVLLVGEKNSLRNHENGENALVGKPTDLKSSRGLEYESYIPGTACGPYVDSCQNYEFSGRPKVHGYGKILQATVLIRI